MNIGPNPHDEPCLAHNHPDSAFETIMFAQQIERAYPPPAGVRIRSKWFDHDFGGYTEAVVYYNDTDDEAIEYAYMVEADPEGKLQKWDSEALKAIEAQRKVRAELEAEKATL